MCFRPADVNIEKDCPQCGAKNPFAAVSCSKCGATLPASISIPGAGAPGAAKAPGAPGMSKAPAAPGVPRPSSVPPAAPAPPGRQP